MLIQGITITLYEKNIIGEDGLGNPIFGEPTAVAVENVLISPASETEILDNLQLYGKKSVYTLAIPKGDTHDWRDATVEFFGEKFQTFGNVALGISDLIPLDWNGKIQVARYE